MEKYVRKYDQVDGSSFNESFKLWILRFVVCEDVAIIVWQSNLFKNVGIRSNPGLRKRKILFIDTDFKGLSIVSIGTRERLQRCAYIENARNIVVVQRSLIDDAKKDIPWRKNGFDSVNDLNLHSGLC